ncbi:hypothetical protein K439DRAFT_921494 [Ramaria rubella]|nr:hypothetical protein K439DRAFT_921494 [Ramaria rubella]
MSRLHPNISISEWMLRNNAANLLEEIATLENRLSHLRAYRSKLWRSCTWTSTGLRASIRKLPNEILGDVFIMSLPSISWQEVGDEDHWLFHDLADPYKMHSTMIQSIRRHWSTVLQETPRMWSTIIINQYSLTKLKNCSTGLNLASSMFTSGQQPISLCVATTEYRCLFENNPTVELSNLQSFSHFPGEDGSNNART